LCLLGMTAFLHASDDIQFEYLGLDQGKFWAGVPAILQDRTGYIWFGGFDGLYRYDGYEIKVYQSDPARLPKGFTVLEKHKRTLAGVYQLADQRPEAAFAFLKPTSFEVLPATLQDVYFHVLSRDGREAATA